MSSRQNYGEWKITFLFESFWMEKEVTRVKTHFKERESECVCVCVNVRVSETPRTTCHYYYTENCLPHHYFSSAVNYFVVKVFTQSDFHFNSFILKLFLTFDSKEIFLDPILTFLTTTCFMLNWKCELDSKLDRCPELIPDESRVEETQVIHKEFTHTSLLEMDKENDQLVR